MADNPHEEKARGPGKEEPDRTTRRNFLSKIIMGSGVLASFGLFAAEWFFFIFPRQQRRLTRKIYAGKLSQYQPGQIQTFFDLEGKLVLVKRDGDTLRAFDSTCPHLGCQVHWEGAENRFFCPCHNGVFNPDGVAVSGPPADAGQNLFEVPVHVDRQSGIVYLEVKDAAGKEAT